ncbi:hypothetical protein [Candidatus Vondammii sp. HM_W22]|uniref:hypothetical protein n=1 Tax=Candidatus Vondammii sp. HM_W22 TaxID=2687299 RepID=UPI001F148D96|nr:hypothetical protein [Candidatus Vondammii sp. HM_W22]
MSSRRKGLLVILDGLGDRGIAEFAQRTPLEAADTPNMDRLIRCRPGSSGRPAFPLRTGGNPHRHRRTAGHSTH